MPAHRGAQVRSWRNLALTALAGAVLVASALPVAASAASVGAPSGSARGAAGGSPPTLSPSARLRADAGRIADKLSVDGQRLQQLAERYLDEIAERQSDEASVHVTAAFLRSDAGAVQSRRAELRRAAILAYVGADGANTLDVVLGNAAGKLEASQTYLSAAADQLSSDVTALQQAERRRQLDLTAERRDLDAAEVALLETRLARAAVLATVRSEQHVLRSVRGRLARLVAEEEAARERAELVARERALAAAEAARALQMAKAAAAERAEAAARARVAAADRARADVAAAARQRAKAAEQAAAAERAAAAARAAAAQQNAAAGQAAQQGAIAALAAATAAHPRTSGSAVGATAAPVTGPPTPAGIASVSTSAFPTNQLSEDFARLRGCEASGIYDLNTGNGYYGAYQFSESTWLGIGETGLPSDASPATQDAAAYRLYEQSGWGSWPECSAILGLG